MWTAAADSDQTDIVVVGSVAYLGCKESESQDTTLTQRRGYQHGPAAANQQHLITLLEEGEAGTIWAGDILASST